MEKNDEKDLLVKAPKTTKAQIITVCVVGLCVVLAVVALIIVLVLNSNKTIPDIVKYIENGEEICFEAKANDNFVGYRFKFVEKDGSKELVFESRTSNVLVVSDKSEIEIGKTYDISVCYLGELEGGNSEYSKPYTWLASKYLSVPTNFVITSEALTWDAVDKATKYEVSYSYGTFNTIECTTNSLSLSRLPAGQINVRVVAKSDKSGYKTSFASSPQTVTVYKELEPFVRASIDNTNSLKIIAKQTIDFVELKLGEDGEPIVLEYELGIQVPNFLLTIDISALEIEGKTLYVRPGSDDKYWSYNGEWTEVKKAA